MPNTREPNREARILSPAAPRAVSRGLLKDDVLADLSESANVAQFVSFGPGSDPSLRYTRLQGLPSDYRFPSVREAVAATLSRSGEGSVNVRSFERAQPRGHEFIYGLTRTDDVDSHVRRLAASGLYTIVNETIDVRDGGVSGVSFGGIIEFAPEDTPRCVEKPGAAALPKHLGLRLLYSVYGFRPELRFPPSSRVEFSIHPLKRGTRPGHTIIWEVEAVNMPSLSADIAWPNRFSRFLGDKAFGLLVGELSGLTVPATTVVSRRVAPFRFGQRTGTSEYWIRTAPSEQVPGRFTTRRGWLDPFHLLMQEDERGSVISSVLAQEGVESVYSGAAMMSAGGEPVVEGVKGTGEGFMLGEAAPEALPSFVLREVEQVFEAARGTLGSVRFEWAHDGEQTWVLQLHKGRSISSGNIVYPGAAAAELRFPVERGLEELRALIEEAHESNSGIVLVGDVGLTSHLGDVLRRARIPSRIERPPQ